MSKEKTEQDKPPNVYQVIAKVQGELAKTGIAKDRKNEQQKYKFRGIDDVFNALAPLLAETGLCILPFVESREVTERVTAKFDDKGNKRDSVLFYVTVRVRFDFVSAMDGSKHEVVTYGEAMDSGDKATNKAMSAAYKYACLQAFCIPTEGDNDADGSTHEVVAAKGEFGSEEMRGRFESECLNAISSALTADDLKNVRVSNLARWNAMKDSKASADVDSYARIVTGYNARLTEFKKQADAKPKPATVEAAKKSPAAVLGDDEIPF